VLHAGRTRWSIARPGALFAAVGLVGLVLVLLISGALAAPAVTTDKAEYLAYETVTISGSAVPVAANIFAPTL